jgi:hypothetical protein
MPGLTRSRVRATRRSELTALLAGVFAVVLLLGAACDYDGKVTPPVPGAAIDADAGVDLGVHRLEASSNEIAHAHDIPSPLARTSPRLAGYRLAPQAINRAGRAYPDVIDPRTGAAIPHPGSGLTRVPVSERVPWGAQERGAYIKQWYDQGFDTPPGGWGNYDIHHIRPREYGGTNAFDNLVPVPRSVHQQEFNAWWRDYG